MKDIIKMVVVLGLICLVAGLALAGVRQVTLEPIEYQRIKNVMEPSVKAVLSGYDNDPIKDRFSMPAGKDKKGRDVSKTVFPAKKGGKLMAVALDGSGKGFNGAIGVMVGIMPDGKMTGISIMSHSDTPGIGSRVAEPVFTDQFKKKTVDDPTSVDGVSGASYSTKGVFAAVQAAAKFYKSNQKELLAKAGQ
ncbi:MAG: FMN-binding protein [Proteobacteria bacterium]|nr:FMN-binding protein [Pseudomonadota bacterium]